MRLEAEVEERRGLVWPFSAVGLCAALLGFVAFRPAVSATTFIVSAGIVTLLSFFALVRTAPKRIAGKRRVGVDERGLAIDGKLVLPRQSILRARVKDAPTANGASTVVVEARGLGATHIIRVQSARVAQGLADALEQEAQDVAQFNALPPWAHRMRWLTVIMTASPWILFNVLRHLPPISIFVVIGLYALIAVPLVVPQKVSIGEDGLLLKWAGRRRFVSWASVQGVRSTSLGVELDLTDDHALEIRITQRADAEAVRRNAMLDRIERGIAAHRLLAPAEDESLLTRGSRSLEEWIQEMTRLGMGDASGYRVMAIPRERLWAVLENAAADRSAREGAAIALHARLDEEERDRIEAIAQKSASPRLRIALDAVVSHGTGDPKLRVHLEEAEDLIEEEIHAPSSREERERAQS